MNRCGAAGERRAEAFQRIVRYYESRYARLRRRDQLPYRLTDRGAWATSDPEQVYYFFSRIELEQCNRLVDLGSGDGIVTCIAGLFTRAVGIEIDKGLVRAAKRAVQRLDLDRRVHVVCADYTRLPLTWADCFYIYPDKPIRDPDGQLRERGQKLLVYGPHFPVDGWEVIGELSRGRGRMTIYRPL